MSGHAWQLIRIAVDLGKGVVVRQFLPGPLYDLTDMFNADTLTEMTVPDVEPRALTKLIKAMVRLDGDKRPQLGRVHSRLLTLKFDRKSARENIRSSTRYIEAPLCNAWPVHDHLEEQRSNISDDEVDQYLESDDDFYLGLHCDEHRFQSESLNDDDADINIRDSVANEQFLQRRRRREPSELDSLRSYRGARDDYHLGLHRDEQNFQSESLYDDDADINIMNSFHNELFLQRQSRTGSAESDSLHSYNAARLSLDSNGSEVLMDEMNPIPVQDVVASDPDTPGCYDNLFLSLHFSHPPTGFGGIDNFYICMSRHEDDLHRRDWESQYMFVTGQRPDHVALRLLCHRRGYKFIICAVCSRKSAPKAFSSPDPSTRTCVPLLNSGLERVGCLHLCPWFMEPDMK